MAKIQNPSDTLLYFTEYLYISFVHFQMVVRVKAAKTYRVMPGGDQG